MSTPRDLAEAAGLRQVVLSRHNLQTLLNKLDRARSGEYSACSIVKNDTVHPKYPLFEPLMITAVEDEDYYVDREPGPVHSEDEISPCS